MATKKYKKAKIYMGKDGDVKNKWFVYYSFLNPFTAQFERFKVYEDINRCKDPDEKIKYAKDLVKEIDLRLTSGYDPFKAEEKMNELVHGIKAEALIQENRKSPTLLEAFKSFLEQKGQKNLAKSTMDAYQGYIAKFENYLFTNRLADIRLNAIDTKFISDCLVWVKTEYTVNETTYNNLLANWVTLLNWFGKPPRKWVNREDFHIGNDGELEPKQSRPMKHQYFGDTVGEKVKEIFKKMPALEFYSKFIYFSCMRPDEIRELRIENVDLKGRYIKIVGKTKSRTVPMCDELHDLIFSLNISKYPTNYYVIGRGGQVSETIHSENYFSEMFRMKVKVPMGLSKDFTLYGWKHTRVVDLLNAGYSDAEVMNLTGHQDTSSYDKYKRELVNHIKTRLKGKTIGW